MPKAKRSRQGRAGSTAVPGLPQRRAVEPRQGLGVMSGD
jgi:hypothetical protein